MLRSVSLQKNMLTKERIMSHPSAEDRMPPKYSMVRRLAAVWKEGGREANHDTQNASLLAHLWQRCVTHQRAEPAVPMSVAREKHTKTVTVPRSAVTRIEGSTKSTSDTKPPKLMPCEAHTHTKYTSKDML